MAKPVLVLPIDPPLPPMRSQREVEWDVLLVQLTHDLRDMALVVSILRERPELRSREALARPIRLQLDGMLQRLTTLRASFPVK